MKEILSNRGLWVAVFALLGMILMDTIPNFNAGRYQEYVNTFLFILAAAGVIPVSKKMLKVTKDKQNN
ncbi:hypothetical protein [Bacillus wiedmannii]|uniref:hypothetical protein n=1 Tax=Bacillus wiedmannii TaxID=1890302 RepID=UPI000B437B7A|nr:hypothetical protein [Bacillus cereus]OUB47929.1 hypothetical protein BK740_07240 [Bacillus thuringiensis serovar argentinensis]